MRMGTSGLFIAYEDIWLLDGVRTPFVDYCGALGLVSPIDLGIRVARAIRTHQDCPTGCRLRHRRKRGANQL